MSINSEIGRLRRVIVHWPGRALELLIPGNIREKDRSYLLMDDLLDVPVAFAEHDLFCSVLNEAAEVIHFTSLLSEILEKDSSLRISLAIRAGLPHGAAELPALKLAKAILSGEYQSKLYGVPCVNLLFTRDVTAVIGKALLLSYPALFPRLFVKRPRSLEMELVHLVARKHPLFNDFSIIDINADHDEKNQLSIEGGDIFPLSDEIVAIGVSERTSVAAIKRAAPGIFNQGFNRILMVRIPKDRGSMHLDTVFSRISANECVVYEPALSHANLKVEALESGSAKVSKLNGSFIEILESVLDSDFVVYPCGGSDALTAEREQWTDGANFLALAPGVIISYDRNRATINHLSRYGGYGVLQAVDFINQSQTYLTSERKVVIVIPSAELSRGRGGPRCMSLPLDRD